MTPGYLSIYLKAIFQRKTRIWSRLFRENKNLVRPGSRTSLCFCLSHQRESFIIPARGQSRDGPCSSPWSQPEAVCWKPWNWLEKTRGSFELNDRSGRDVLLRRHQISCSKQHWLEPGKKTGPCTIVPKQVFLRGSVYLHQTFLGAI